MHGLLGDRWVGGLADHHKAAGECRIEVLGIQNLEQLRGLYFVKKRDPRMVWNYLREIGPRSVLRKIVSRTRERNRNDKYVSCGVGRVIEPAEGGEYGVGQTVVFLAPIAPACVERLVLPEDLVAAVEPLGFPAPPEGTILHRGVCGGLRPFWGALRGWSAYSGERLSPMATATALKEAQELLLGLDWSDARSLPRSGSAAASTVVGDAGAEGPPSGPSRPRAVLFGYGNFAKTVALPNLRAHLAVDRIHEIDPTQIPFRRPAGVVWDTSPHLESGDRDCRAVIIAGYHHTHAPLACEALRAGASVLVEKPLATSRAQLRSLVEAMRETGRPVFAGFQRRYLPFNDLAREDLGAAPGDPIAYHCVVYEVPLPELHWYRWPNSRSSLVSNGCHWIDHFLHLNDYCAVEDYHVASARDGTLNCTVSLANGAFFTMVLTHRGSRRLGVQDHVELRANGVTVKIENMSRYRAEDENRILRSRHINRLSSYQVMYESIARRIAAGEPGDSLRSVQVTTGLVLDLEDRLAQVRAADREWLGDPAVLSAPRLRTVAA